MTDLEKTQYLAWHLERLSSEVNMNGEAGSAELGESSLTATGSNTLPQSGEPATISDTDTTVATADAGSSYVSTMIDSLAGTNMNVSREFVIKANKAFYNERLLRMLIETFQSCDGKRRAAIICAAQDSLGLNHNER